MRSFLISLKCLCIENFECTFLAKINDDHVLAQPGVGASHGEPLADDSDAQDKENVEANDPHGLLPQTL